MSKFPITERSCAGCGTSFFGKGRAKWCSERCRKDQYDQECADCGVRVSGTDPGDRPDPAHPRCNRCQAILNGEARRIWTREIIAERIQEWESLYGYVPGALDWMPSSVRWRIDRGEAPESAMARAERFEAGDGYWPWSTEVFRVFGSWNAAIEAAGFVPRAAHGGADNWKRHGIYMDVAA